MIWHVIAETDDDFLLDDDDGPGMYTLAEADPVAESPAALILSYGMFLQIVPMTLKRNFRKCLKNLLIVEGTEQLLEFKFCYPLDER